MLNKNKDGLFWAYSYNYPTKKMIEHGIQKAMKILDENPGDIEQMSHEKRNEICHILESLSICLRNSEEVDLFDEREEDYFDENEKLSSFSLKEFDYFKAKNEEDIKKIISSSYSENMPCNVSYEDKILIVDVPCLIRKGSSKKNLTINYEIGEYVGASIKKYKHLHNETFEDFSYPALCIVVRYANKFNPSIICDNDNIECSRVINAIVENTLINDNPIGFDLMHKFVETGENGYVGTRFIVIEEKRISEIIDNNNDKTLKNIVNNPDIK